MVRAHMKETPDEKKETHKKKTPSKKKIDTGSWPCKINGCNKVFAREADLKRHQRTTKLHSLPGFACPQCDATFTRTDALRRHQKSRHNGVVIPPAEQDKDRNADGEAGSSGSKSPSPGVTPSRSQGDSGSAKSTPPSASAQPGSSGPGNYYRQHTMTHGYGARAHPGMMMDQHYPQSIVAPTSATRLHQANWHHSPPWPPEAPPPGVYHMPPPGYYTHPYYRAPQGMMPMPPPPHYPPMHPPEYMTTHPPPYHPANGAPPPHEPVAHSADGASQNGKDDDADMEDASSQGSAPVIDPSLDGPTEALHPSAAEAAKAEASGTDDDSQDAVSRQVAEAAMKVLQEYQNSQAQRAANSRGPEVKEEAPDSFFGSQSEETAPRETSRGSPSAELKPAIEPMKSEVDFDSDGDRDADGASAEGEPSIAPKALQSETGNILTEDGETMLNPAELLTQESLASPPPS